jgi:hypothetical protein
MSVPCFAAGRMVTCKNSTGNALDTDIDNECPFCMERMEFVKGGGRTLLVCPNGCPTETETVPRKPPQVESERDSDATPYPPYASLS